MKTNLCLKNNKIPRTNLRAESWKIQKNIQNNPKVTFMTITNMSIKT